MLATSGLFFIFLALYLTRLANLGMTPFPGPQTVYTYVYLPLLAVHIAFAVVCIPLVLYTLVIGTSVDVPEIGRTSHARVGRLAVPLWAISFAFGLIVYSLLHHLY